MYEVMSYNKPRKLKNEMALLPTRVTVREEVKNERNTEVRDGEKL
jgi:hypothetical protein